MITRFTEEEMLNMEENSLLNKSYKEILTEIVEKLNTITDPITGNKINVEIDRPDDVLGIIAAYLAQALSYNNDLMIRFKNALSPLRASGEDLNNVIDYKGLKRKQGVPSTVKVTLTRNSKEVKVIPAGSILTNDKEDKRFILQSDVEYSEESDEVRAIFVCEKNGPVELAVDELTKFFGVYDSNLNNITINNEIASVGSDDENDFEIKYRCELTTSVSGYGFLDIIDSNVMQINGVKSCTSYAYNPNHPVFNQIPPTDIVIMVHYTKDVDGKIEQKIAETIFDKQTFFRGYHFFGDGEADNQGEIITKTVISAYMQREYQVTFMAPKPINVYCVVKLKAGTDLTRYNTKCKEVYKNYFNAHIVPLMTIDASHVTAQAILDYQIPVLRTAFVVGNDKSLDNVDFSNKDCFQHKLAYNEVTILTDDNIRVEVEELE